jgi:hypothetical protein
MMPNLNGHFAAFLMNLDVPADLIGRIDAAKAAVRDRLCRDLRAYARSGAGDRIEVTPRFFTQGSWAYGTLNYPYQSPPQQMDIDLGVYLPMSHLEDRRPSLAAKGFFTQVDAILGRLAEDNHWRLDCGKETCTRLVLDDLVHLDVPLYSIPDQDFCRMPLQAENLGRVPNEADSGGGHAGAHGDVWSDLPADRVLLALRNGDWRESDPRRIHRWFEGEVLAKGEQFRRVIRYLKAWRDKLWRNGGPSSIFLMVVCANSFKEVPGRDDIALSEVLRGVWGSLRSPVIIPNGSGEDITGMQKPEDLQILREEAFRFHRDLAAAMDSGVASERSLMDHLGSRFQAPRRVF